MLGQMGRYPEFWAPAEKRIVRWNSSMGILVWGCWGAKTEIPVTVAAQSFSTKKSYVLGNNRRY